MASDWSQKLQFQFLDAYEQEQEIWDPNHPTHKDKKRVKDAWARISTLLDIPVKDLKAKKDSLMATYRGYCRKIAGTSKPSSAEECAVYKPIWFAFDRMDRFLGHIYNSRTCSQNSKSNLDEIHFDFSMEHEDSLEVANNISNLKQEKGVTTGNSSKSKTNFHAVDPLELQNTSQELNYSLEPIYDVVTKKNESDDECELFGKLVAKKLRCLSEDDREDLMFEIQQLFHAKSLKRRRKNFPNTSPSSSLNSP